MNVCGVLYIYNTLISKLNLIVYYACKFCSISRKV
jgi:hypothetical protein